MRAVLSSKKAAWWTCCKRKSMADFRHAVGARQAFKSTSTPKANVDWFFSMGKCQPGLPVQRVRRKQREVEKWQKG